LSARTLLAKTYIQAESEGMKKIFQAWGIQNQVGVAIFISDITDFKSKFTRRDREGNCILIKGIIHQEDMIINTYTLNVGASNVIHTHTCTHTYHTHITTGHKEADRSRNNNSL
jgi:hypothetical protein